MHAANDTPTPPRGPSSHPSPTQEVDVKPEAVSDLATPPQGSTPNEANLSHPQETSEHSNTADETQTHTPPLQVPSPAEDSHTPRPQTGSGESVTREQTRPGTDIMTSHLHHHYLLQC